MVFTTEGFSEVAIESWPEWDLDPQPLNSTQILYIYIIYILHMYIYIYVCIGFCSYHCKGRFSLKLTGWKEVLHLKFWAVLSWFEITAQQKEKNLKYFNFFCLNSIWKLDPLKVMILFHNWMAEWTFEWKSALVAWFTFVQNVNWGS